MQLPLWHEELPAVICRSFFFLFCVLLPGFHFCTVGCIAGGWPLCLASCLCRDSHTVQCFLGRARWVSLNVAPGVCSYTSYMLTHFGWQLSLHPFCLCSVLL